MDGEECMLSMGKSSVLRMVLRSVEVIVMTILLLALTVVKVEAVNDDGLDKNNNKTEQTGPGTDPRMDATHEKRYGQDFVWQIPPNPKAILFMAHGGFKNALSYFDPGHKCQLCTGLPEDRTVVREALRRGFAVIALKSIRVSGWDTVPIEASKDLVIATKVIPEWTRVQSSEGLPLFGWGHSAGGYFLTALTLRLSFRGLVLMCIDGLREMEEIATPQSFPPTFFTYMPVDEGMLSTITRAVAKLRERGVEVAEKQLWPKPVSPLFFTERIRCMTAELSQKVYWAYKASGWLDSEDYLTKNPIVEDWEAVLWNLKALPFCEEANDLFLASHVLQELQMAFAFHSLTSDANEEIYSWLDSLLLLSIDPASHLSVSE